jgi:hypothetical protein
MVKIDISQANSNMIFANDLDGVAYASVRMADSQFNVINGNYLTGNLAHGLEVGANAIDNTVALNTFVNNPEYGVAEASALGSARNSYTGNKFDNTGLAAASLRQAWTTFNGNTIRQANLLEPGAAVVVAANTSYVSVNDNKVSSTGGSVVGIQFSVGSGDRCKVIGNNVGHLPTGVDMAGVAGAHNDVAYNN